MKTVKKFLSFALAILAAVPFSVSAQSFIVKGNVAIRGGAVKFASVTFINSSDTATQFSALTDSSGNYQLNLTITSVKPNNAVPTDFALEQNYPNPFSSSTAIPYQINKQSDVKVTIYDILGRKIRSFNVGLQSAGAHGVVWDGRSEFGEIVAPGVYFYRLQAQGKSEVKKMVFGMGQSTTSITLPGMISSQTYESGAKGADAILAGGTFNVLITNMNNTSPIIIPMQFNNVGVSSDTTLNYTVSAAPHAIVYLDSAEQTIRGFGAANIVGWRPDMTTAEVQTAYDSTGNLGFSIMRLRIPPDSTQFSIDIASAKLAQSYGAKIIATPWTPPTWMKTNNAIAGGYLIPSAYAAYASHLQAFADTMTTHGVSLYAISVQNEPDANVTYESCFWNATQFLNFMKNNAASVGTPIFMPESESFTHQLSDSTLNDPSAAANVAFVGGHIYGATPASYPLAASKGKEIWMTEHLTTSTDSGNVWPAALPVGKEINDCMSANMSAYIWWYIVRFYGPIDENGNITKRGYIMSQYARFVRPGFHRVYSTLNVSSGTNAYVTAYKEGANIVIVVVNMGSSSVNMNFSLMNGTADHFASFVTSATKNCLEGNDFTVSNGNFSATLEPSSVTTFVSW
ncbi:MAG TPA: T9SS type A sorting domain-containing protein [Bacteroidota bacterium]|nr:T9SS type A sorting domain-containing protein [Bacteroidota bacterium]